MPSWTWRIAISAWSARIRVSSSMLSTLLRATARTIDAAGSWLICGSIGPRTECSHITISSAASAISVPPDIA